MLWESEAVPVVPGYGTRAGVPEWRTLGGTQAPVRQLSPRPGSGPLPASTPLPLLMPTPVAPMTVLSVIKDERGGEAGARRSFEPRCAGRCLPVPCRWGPLVMCVASRPAGSSGSPVLTRGLFFFLCPLHGLSRELGRGGSQVGQSRSA